ADIQQWKSARLKAYAAECENNQRKLRDAGDALGARLDSLIGSSQTVNAAKAALHKQIVAIEKEVNFLISSAEIASEGVQGINEIRANIDDAKQLAHSWKMTIDSNGNVSMDAAQVKRLRDSGHSRKEIQRAVDTAQQRVNSALEQARSLAESLSQKISALDAGTYDNNVHYSATNKIRPSLPPAGTSAQEVASWWSSLSDDDKQWMIQQHPDVIGNLEGVDYTSRNQANRIMLPIRRKEVMREAARYEQTLGPHPTEEQRAEMDRLRNRVRAIEQIENTLAKEDSDRVPRYLMSLDTSGANVLAAISQNNPDDADHIGVIVPGMSTSVAGNSEGGSILDYDGHAKVMRESAEKAAGRGQKVAMVEFFGYDAPPSVTEASTPIMAAYGAHELASFLNGIDAVREHGAGDAHITVAAHSYGSTTAGMAATLVGEGVIDDLVQFGSPGSGVQDVGEFHVPEGHVYVSAAPYLHDVVQGIGPDDWFGKNPDKMEGYKHLSGDVGPAPSSYEPWDLHSAYFHKGTQANQDIASVIGGKPNV
ncbi:MAG: alpha/beta hydrolase, partial [Schaalia sp.]|nr:alpha/beta hydrolase [Schaalia sp.]